MALQPQDVERLNALLNGLGEVEYGGMAQMYVAAWGPRQKLQDWVNSKVEGMLCLVFEYRTSKHFFMIFDVRTGEVIYEFELYQGIFYREAMPNFHAYETSDGYVGFGFLSSRVAKQFHELVTNRASSAEQLMSGAFFNDDGSINLAQLPGQWKKLLQDAGFTSEELSDPAFTGMIVQVLQEVGLTTQAPERNQTRQQLLAQGYSQEQVLTYEQYMRDLAAYEEQLRKQNTHNGMSFSAPTPAGRGSAVSAGGSGFYMAGYETSERAGSGYGDLQRGSQYSGQSQQAYESRPRGGSQQAYESRPRGGSQQASDSRQRGGSQHQQQPPQRSPRDQQQSRQVQQQQAQQTQMQQQQQQKPPPAPRQQQQQQQQQKAQQTPSSTQKQQQQQSMPQQLKPPVPPPQQQQSKRASLSQQLRRSLGSLMSSSSKSSQAQSQVSSSSKSSQAQSQVSSSSKSSQAQSQAQAQAQAQAPRQETRQSPAQPSESPSGVPLQDTAAGQRAPRRKKEKEKRYEQGTFGASASKLEGAATLGRKKPGHLGPAPVAPPLPAMLADIPLQGQSQGQGRPAPAPRPGPGGLLAGDLINGASKLKPPKPNLAQLRTTVLPDIAGMQAAKQSDLLARLQAGLNDRRKRLESDSDDDTGTTDEDWK
jgi:hypothetical protein